MSDFKEPVTTYRDIAAEWWQGWFENMLTNWATWLVLTAINGSLLYLYYDGTYEPFYPIEVQWAAGLLGVCFLVVDLRRGFDG